MTSTLLVQFASQNIALFCCALFAGAATYVSLVEHPRLDEGEAELADTTLVAAHPRPAIFQAALGVVGSLAAMLAGSAAGAMWWLAGGAVLRAAAVWEGVPGLPLVPRLSPRKGGGEPRKSAPNNSGPGEPAPSPGPGAPAAPVMF